MNLWRFLGCLLVFGMVLAALKLAIAILLIAGLIFRTKETIGVLALIWIVWLFDHSPLLAFGLLGALLVAAFFLKGSKASGGGTSPYQPGKSVGVPPGWDDQE